MNVSNNRSHLLTRTSQHYNTLLNHLFGALPSFPRPEGPIKHTCYTACIVPCTGQLVEFLVAYIGVQDIAQAKCRGINGVEMLLSSQAPAHKRLHAVIIHLECSA